ncbi:fructosamine kinase family protein [Thioalkalivibrio sp. XN8]|uniref:fructosamine kinase family protein n=1 Tax=Thioalkalivibrio sp. XN8 TaxID=2712863 RepID=UPI0013EB132C|nr:fructosamine kinase family protein [Thioalkalivibrio sp. XN8]NGP53455.1 fructosamine kinase family protein [Thioalkalivibrio sp. XN8]
MTEPDRVLAALAAAGLRVAPDSARPVGGGCIHRAWRLESATGPVFLKTNAATAAWMLAAEADGLAGLAAAGALRVPAVLGHGVAAGLAWLALEWLELHSPDAAAEAALGAGLAAQHRVAGPYFGWHQDNAIGASPQQNTPDDDWGRFFAEQRIGAQLELGRRHGLPAGLLREGEALVARIPAWLAERQVAPALLHGDLWGGNRAADATGRPVVFDPATHYGDPECDLAMTRLFGGFGSAFYQAYDAALAPAPGRDWRLGLYQLYHVLNHANLFGGGYIDQARRLMSRLAGRG